MDSFYDAPRRTPLFPPVEKLASAPVVPDISVLCPSNGPTNNYVPYNQWKSHQSTLQGRHIPMACKENIPLIGLQNTSYIKKQVRFESPGLQQKTHDVLTTRNLNQNGGNTLHMIENQKRNIQPTFEEIYMANIPNRHLDLSIIEVPKKVLKNNIQYPRENEEEKEEPPKTYREFLTNQKVISKGSHNDSRRDMENYPLYGVNSNCVGDVLKNKMNYSITKTVLPTVDTAFSVSNPLGNTNAYKSYPMHTTSSSKHSTSSNMSSNCKKCDIDTQTSRVLVPTEQPVENINKEEPTVKDLLKIISQQNEQLLLLQKQVATLIQRDQFNPKQIEPTQQQSEGNYITSTQHEHYRQAIKDSPRKRGLPKFSIGLMTSFEVSFRPQHNGYQNKRDFVNNFEPKIQEITEADTCSRKSETMEDKMGDRTVVDTSLFLQEPLDVRETCPSPEPSIKIDMNDYDDSEDEEFSSSEFGSTFYKNLMDQINKILTKAKVQADSELSSGSPRGEVQDKTMNRVKEATLKHLRSIGINIPPSEDSSSSSEEYGKHYSPSEISFAVKQLLMKYLPSEHLAKVSYKKSRNIPVNTKEKKGAIPIRPEFSFATVQYMKKYNLIASNKDVAKQSYPESPKILDISTLKQQPKLL